MKKEFSAPVVVGLYTGIALTQFGQIHEAAQHLMGHPIWTHEFADTNLWEKMRGKLLAMFPDLDESIKLVDGCTPENYQEKVDGIIARWPQGFTFENGDEKRAENPIGSLERILERT